MHRMPARSRRYFRDPKVGLAATGHRPADGRAKGFSMESIPQMMLVQKERLESQVDDLHRLVAVQSELTGVNPLLEEMVTDYFAAQRSRVEKLVGLACERAATVCASKTLIDGSANSSQLLGISADMRPSEGSSYAQQEEIMLGVDLDDKKFLENILALMLKEESFPRQVNLMEGILRVKDTATLDWFLTKSTICHILEKWLSKATIEEQTTVIHVLLKVLKHLLSGQTLPKDMSTLMHAVEQLQFYREPDIAVKANSLLRAWNKLFPGKVRKRSYTNLQKDPQTNILTHRFTENCSCEQCEAKVDNSEEILAHPESTENNRLIEKLLAKVRLGKPCPQTVAAHYLLMTSRRLI